MSMLYNDLEEEQAKYWASLLVPQSFGSVQPLLPTLLLILMCRSVYDSAITHATYKDVPSGYILTTKDKAFIHDYQLKTVAMAGFPKERTKTMDTGHCPFLTKPEEVKDFVVYIAEGAKA